MKIHTSLTDKYIKSIKPPPPKGRDEYRDTASPRLSLRVSYGGTKTWQVIYRLPGHTDQWRLKIGNYPDMSLADARKEAIRVRGDVASGKNPAEAKRQYREAETLKELAEHYMEVYSKPRKATWKQDAQNLKKWILPNIGKMKIRDIRRKHIKGLLDLLIKEGKYTQSNRVKSLLNMILKEAVEKEIIEYNPVLGISLAKEESRDRVYDDDEIKRIWNAAGNRTQRHETIIKLRFLTAQRGGEIHLMKWENLDFDTDWWTIPGADTKNGREHMVPLTKPAISLIKAMPKISRFVFQSPFRKDQPVWARSEIQRKMKKDSEVPDFRAHDIRRTVATNITAIKKIPERRLVVSKLLNHSEKGATKIYDRNEYNDEKQQALELWENRLQEILKSA